MKKKRVFLRGPVCSSSGTAPGAEQALTLRDLRNRQISGNRVQPSQP
jgi:hypothetical protein